MSRPNSNHAPIQTEDVAPAPENTKARRRKRRLFIGALLKPHTASLVLGFIAVLGEAAANLLEPWPLKLVLDNVLRSKDTDNWIFRLAHATVGDDKFAIVKFACGAVLAIAALDAVSSYSEKYLTTSVGQWITHDLRRGLYSHIQKLSLAYLDQARTGDLISRVTEDIDNIQSFIVSGLLSSVINVLTLLGMVVVMFWMNWRFTLIALSIAPPLFVLVYTYTRRIKKASRAVRKQEGAIVSIVEEALNSIRVVKAFAREDYEQRRLEEQSLESVEIALRARSLKAKLTPLVDLTVAVGTALVLWFGARLALSGSLSPGSLVLFVFYLGKMYKPMQELSKMTDTYSKSRKFSKPRKRSKTCPAPVAPPNSKGTSNSNTSPFTTSQRTRSWKTSASRSNMRNSPRWWGRPAPARPRSSA